MGRSSVRADKNIYQRLREEKGLTREEASNLLEFISNDRIEKIESGKSSAHPDEVLIMAEKYNFPYLWNYYCANECPIGHKYVPEIQAKELPQIVLEMLNSLNVLEKQKERLISIAYNGKIDNDEVEDFISIQNELENLSLSVQTLKLWTEQIVGNGEIDVNEYDRLKKSK